MAVAAKIVTRVHLQAMKIYDWLILVSTTSALVETICIVRACKHGLGQHQDALSSSSLEIYAKVRLRPNCDLNCD